MQTRIWVFQGLLCVVVLFPLRALAQTPGSETASVEYCGRTDCRALAQILNNGVSAATQQFEASRSGLHPHKVYLEGLLSRLISYIEEMLRADSESQQPKTTIAPSGTSQQTRPDSILVYNLDDVKGALFSTKQALITTLKQNPDLNPLVAHVEQEFPVNPPTTQVGHHDYVEASAWDLFVGRVEDFLRGLLVKGVGPVSLHFRSTPEVGADVALNTFNGPRSTVTGAKETEGWIRNLTLGRYSYKVARNQFSPGDGDLDVANDKREDVECYLRRPGPKGSQTSTCTQIDPSGRK